MNINSLNLKKDILLVKSIVKYHFKNKNYIFFIKNTLNVNIISIHFFISKK